MKTAFIISFSFLSAWCFAQVKISGKVLDNNKKPVPYANVFIKDSYDGGSTAEDGSFSFTTDVTGEATLGVSAVGFETYEQAISLGSSDLVVNPVIKEKVSELNTVVITAGSFEASDAKKAVIMRPLDIVTTAGASGDIYGALQTLPGTTPVGEEEGLFVRGGSAAETKTIIDEMVVQNPFFSSVPDVPQRGRFSPFLFKGTIFSTGGYSAVYGQALSSALILNTTDLPGGSSTGIGLMPVGANVSHTERRGSTAVSLSGGYTNLKPYFMLQKQLTEWDEEPNGINGSLIVQQKTSETGIFKLYTTYSQSDLSMYFRTLDSPQNKSRFELENKNTYVNSSFKERIGEKWTLFTGLSYTKDVDDILNDTIDISSDEELGQAKVILSRGLSGSSMLKFGAEVHDQDADGTFNRYKGTINELYSAGFIETDFFLSHKLAFRTGVRYEYSQFLEQSNVAPRTSIAYKTGANSQVSFAYGSFYQTPENRFLFQDRNLDFERADHYILNYQRMNDDRTFRVEAYQKDYRQLVKYNFHSADWLNNSGTGYARGFDIFWRDKKTMKNTDYWVSYSFLDTKRLYREFPVSASPTFTSNHSFSLVYKYWISKIRTSIGATYTYASGRPYFNPNRPTEEFLSDRTPDYHNLSLNGSRLTSLWGHFTVIFFSVNNALGRENVFNYRYSSDGKQRMTVGPPNLRNFFIGCFISIGDAN